MARSADRDRRPGPPLPPVRAVLPMAPRPAGAPVAHLEAACSSWSAARRRAPRFGGVEFDRAGFPTSTGRRRPGGRSDDSSSPPSRPAGRFLADAPRAGIGAEQGSVDRSRASLEGAKAHCRIAVVGTGYVGLSGHCFARRPVTVTASTVDEARCRRPRERTPSTSRAWRSCSPQLEGRAACLHQPNLAAACAAQGWSSSLWARRRRRRQCKSDDGHEVAHQIADAADR